jgi:hypothetical protein
MRDTFTIEYIVGCEASEEDGTAEGDERWPSIGRSLVAEPVVGDHGVNDDDHEPERGTSVVSSDLDVDHDAHLPIQVRRLSDIVSEPEEREPQLHVLSSEEPASLMEAHADLS